MKKKKKIIIFGVIGVFLLGLGIGVAYYVFGVDFIFFSPDGGDFITISNPVIGLSDEEAIEQFDENFVLYLMARVGAGELHNPPLSSNTPKIEFDLGGEFYYVEIRGGGIYVGEGRVEGEDMVIVTSKSEAVKMIRDAQYIGDSFRNGGSSVELVVGKPKLIAKGYYGLYKELTGKEIKN